MPAACAGACSTEDRLTGLAQGRSAFPGQEVVDGEVTWPVLPQAPEHGAPLPLRSTLGRGSGRPGLSVRPGALT